jgi:hypothetical protein
MTQIQRDETTVLSFIDDTHPAATELLYAAVVRDGLSDHWRESYICETGKSMKAAELGAPQQDSWRNISITLIDPNRPILNECKRSHYTN